ncbi:serine--tRNA ligase [Candidatus Woesearchaeota archaeon CG10_big_fil_rev_8_21_14_0_10_34_12]|nr:MAG: serine--tRNA ligase [Candidatus Woesearchaeota archaeon CG10_big_fil_rev_8_21_14_0_10_34_12]
MLDIKLIRENSAFIKKNCKNRGYDEKIVAEILDLDNKWRKLKQEDDELRRERNKASEEINQAKKKKDEKKAGEFIRSQKFKEFLKKAKDIADKIDNNETEEKELREKIDSLLATIPNIQKEDVPVGDESKNKEISKWGKLPKIKNPKSHLELGESLDLIDIRRATKIAGAGFYLLKGKIAVLQRALVQFMLDFHNKNGFTEINPPQLVNKKTAFGTGNLPKFEDQLYKTNDDLMLIPTAEVPVTNIFANETLNEKELPKKFCAFTQCYRTEAGRRAGEEGLFRLHEFEKVEMVYICKQEDSWKFLEEMTKNAEEILKRLEIPYRKILLATADAGFASAKTYDLETYSPYLKKYLETSSCSNCTDFQARRMNTKYQSKGELKFAHTLNGSGLALSRLMITLIENNQQEDGSIKVPKVLWKYTGFKEIGKEK